MATRDALVSRIRDRLTRSHYPRLTILIILAFAGGTAFLTSFVGLAAGVDSMAARYAFASLAGYLAFVVLIRGWIALRRNWAPDGDMLNPFDAADMATSVGEAVGRGGGRGVQAARALAGGQSGGGGGGAAWVPEPLESMTPVASSIDKTAAVNQVSAAARDAGVRNGSAASSDAGWGFSIDFDEAGIFIGIAILAALGGVLCVAYVIYIAPLLLAEVALDAALVTAAYRRLRREDVGHWAGTVFRRTWIPAALLVFFMFVAGVAAQLYAPEARSIGGVVRVLLS